MALSAGTKLGPYEIISVVGAGGMGEVYRARDARLDRFVAIKVLPASFASDSERLRRFEQEARAVAALNHPNILAIHDIGSQDGTSYLVSELLEGSTLRQQLANGALPARKAIEYAQQTAQGLAAAHEKGIVHRDLKPENIFVSKDGRVKILDFGLAKAQLPAATADGATVASQTSPGVVLGTAGYMSPEQVRGQDIDYRSDIFSLGSVLYEMLSGVRAFKGETSVETMNAILKEDPPELPTAELHVAPAVERIVRRCLEKQREERFQSARDLGFALEALSGSSTASAAQAAIASAPQKKRWLALLALAALSVVFVAGQLVHKLFHPVELPRYRQITFRRGSIENARFAPDGETVLYSASWEGSPVDLFSGRTDSPGGRALGMPQTFLLSISSSGDVAILANRIFMSGYAVRGTLERVPFSGGAPRPLLQDVGDAGWGPTGSDLAVTRYIPRTNTWRLEYPIGKMLYETSGWIDAPRVSPKGSWVAFLDHPTPDGDNRGTVAIVDLAGNKKTLTRTWTGASGLAWTASGKELMFSGSDSGLIQTLWAVSLSGKLRALARAPASLVLQDVNRQGRALVRKDSAHLVIEALGPGQTHERELDWLDWSLPRELSADGKFVLFEEEGEGGGPQYTVYMRPTDGSPALELGHGVAMEISPDEKWVLTRPLGVSPAPLVLLPTGAGEPREITHDQINHLEATWFPDGKRILFLGSEPGKSVRDFTLEVDSGRTRPVTPEGISGKLLSPDSKTILLRGPQGAWVLWPVEGGEPRPVPALGDKDEPYQWTADGKAVYLGTDNTADNFPKVKVYALDMGSGQRRLVGSYGPSDVTGVSGYLQPSFSRDGKSYAYSYVRGLSELYAVDGLN